MEVDLLINYPRITRDISQRVTDKNVPDIKLKAKKYDWEYFDRKTPRVCYGGYLYDARWQAVVTTFVDYYKLKDNNLILDVGCAKGYMLYDFKMFNPSFGVVGVDISEYAIGCCPPEVDSFVCDAKDLSMFYDKIFDLVISINTIHNLSENYCRKAVREIERVGNRAFICVDAYRNDEEKKRMLDWNVTAETILSVADWKKLFSDEGYTGDYYWFVP